MTSPKILTLRVDQLDADAYPGYIQTILNMIRSSEYVTTGEYYQMLSDDDLDELLNAVEMITTPEEGEEDAESLENIMMLAMLLRTAEGMPDITEDEVYGSIGMVCSYAAIEKLARLGDVEVFYSNMCVTIDNLAADRIVVRKL